MADFDITGVAGADGADGVNPGDPGQDGGDGGDASQIVTSDDAFNNTLVTVTGGAGGHGGDGAAGAPGGDGGDGGAGGDALAAIDGLAGYDVNVIQRRAIAYGGNYGALPQAYGGSGGDADPETAVASDAGAGGDGGDGGDAHARVSGVLAYITGSGASYVSLRPNATGADGGGGGGGGWAGTNVHNHDIYAAEGLDGDGGSATAEMLNNTVVGGSGADLIDMGSIAAGGNGRDSGAGGEAVETYTGNVVRAGAGADEMYIYASAIGGRFEPAAAGAASALGIGGVVFGREHYAAATLTFTDNLFDGGADDDLFHVYLVRNYGEVTVAGNSFFGGDGHDVLSFRENSGPGSSGIDFDLRDNHVRDIEQIIGSDRRDHLTGAARSDNFDGARGNDKIVGGGGDDTIAGGLGDDRLKGGKGTDLVSFAGSATAVTVDFAAGTATGEGNDSFKGFEGVSGSTHDDVITDGAGASDLRGDAGADTLTGGGGSDTLIGGDGADRYLYASTADSASGAGDTIIAFEVGVDLVDLSAIDADETSDADDAFTFNLGGPSGAPEVGVLYVTAASIVSDIAQADTDGDGTYDLAITFGLSSDLSATDFVL